MSTSESLERVEVMDVLADKDLLGLHPLSDCYVFYTEYTTTDLKGMAEDFSDAYKRVLAFVFIFKATKDSKLLYHIEKSKDFIKNPEERCLAEGILDSLR